jgi:hypothetical protein
VSGARTPYAPPATTRAVTTGLRRRKLLILNKMLAGSTGLEPAASGVTGRRSNQLNYDPKEISRILRVSQV